MEQVGYSKGPADSTEITQYTVGGPQELLSLIHLPGFEALCYILGAVLRGRDRDRAKTLPSTNEENARYSLAVMRTMI